MNTGKRTILWTLVAGLVLSSSLVWAGPAEDAAKVFADGKVLLKKGDLAGAKKAFASAAKTDAEKTEYRLMYQIVSRAIKMREALASEKSPAKWAKMAQALEGIYVNVGLYNDALALARQIHERLNTPESASALASLQLKMGQNAEAAKLLGALDAKSATPQTQSLLALALARQGKTAEAKALAARVVLPADAHYNTLISLAAVNALTGNSTQADALLVRSFEATPPGQLTALKAAVKKSKDFAAVASTPGFEKALATETKVKESKCSGGGDCSKCPSRAKGSCKDTESCPDKK